ncbi:DNA-binding transcriptional activator of the SARP family [Nakamurella panacisegetis]|uniref:DNA-binding transcriptional activator of the SARP family n=1 Tax=Nakamurella panacisegetis TaxID=1090615 RepID=A0A1H0HD11_9ACTN|nr:BTAD domain-containing putative transcriptional regulator [Nakamurella panacisegetis]SDO16934.1 DNA-binding transcriptional activator of the SARP family [Nakamurella panacisegetis]
MDESPPLKPRRIILHLIGGPYVTIDDRPLVLPEGSMRLLVFVSIQGPSNRRHIAATLWPDVNASRAAGNLRSALWRLRPAGVELVASTTRTISLAADVLVDVAQLDHWSDRVLNGRATVDDLLTGLPVDTFDLLPEWDDDWVVAERTRLRQRALHALEAAGRDLLSLGRHADALTSVLCAVRADPLRESARRLLIEVHLAEGNRTDAQQVYASYRATLRRELGMEPSRQLAAITFSELAMSGAQPTPPTARPTGISRPGRR